ncbi:aminoglycoside phosphotransferase family protein [Streptomyces sp. NBC_00503]|uniref:aminoglycoside phosphotransferase family protein n=1 Tax=Streptomyces sp. NBC_00503 TaxID=2903659 RepID=UPI002E812522|nr:aminoglycoside phosphotransferase family protein [Streptomyces sp. NBC_00503]WUD85117.1 aminoglycoside phosphotransferase family protein [Streptomyces sp. NBC_00503]
MPAGKMHDGEPDIDTALVRRLIAAQFPRWAQLPVERVDSAGTQNAMYRLGEDMVVRLPRTAGAAQDVVAEHVWLRRLAPALAVAVPEPLTEGRPGNGYPWPWSVFRWLSGAIPVAGRIDEPERLAADLARFVLSLRGVDPTDAPPSYRSETLAARDTDVRAAIAGLAALGEIDAAAVSTVWDTALRAPARPGPPVWIHADLQPGNMLLADGRLAAVIDFGCAGLGDPAVDLIPAWYVLPSAARPVFRAALATDDGMWARARGWALSIALMELDYYRNTNPTMASTARHVITETLTDQ